MKGYSDRFIESNRNFTNVKYHKYVLSDVYIDLKSGLILDNNKHPIWELAYEVLYWGPPIKGKYFDNPKELDNIVETRKQAHLERLSQYTDEDYDKAYTFNANEQVIYLIHPFGWYPYGHLHDSLQRLYQWKDVSFSNPKLLCSDFKRVVEFDKHINACGYAFSTVFSASKLTKLVRVSNLFVGINPAMYTTLTAESYDWLMSGYRSVFGESNNSIPGIYLSRNGIKKGARGVINDNEVQEYLKGKGFVIIDGTEPLEKIYQYFSNANCVVAPHGSLLVNTIFCKRESKIIEFCPNNRPDFSFKNKHKDAFNYKHILLEGDESYNIKIPLEMLEQEL
ncbi:glycosyltransferase 61 family protein [Alteromonas macleodii]|uniref:Glycosyltransferase 61 catalytic domain-containing protein n=1 Tax=Alteromonas macleodii TaxID=28108 RepID=A0A6T9Y843_ALTMA|nr:glycosyltransferase family 61 protein [Alteromonas macleodii]CAB9495510.1 protein of unknown function [Alteromonas macleodii]